jgi:hypothetical protein
MVLGQPGVVGGGAWVSEGWLVVTLRKRIMKSVG